MPTIIDHQKKRQYECHVWKEQQQQQQQQQEQVNMSQWFGLFHGLVLFFNPIPFYKPHAPIQTMACSLNHDTAFCAGDASL